MAYIEVTEPYAQPPKLVAPDPSETYDPDRSYDDRGLIELTDLAASDAMIDLTDAEVFEIDGSTITRMRAIPGEDATTEIRRSTLVDADLSGLDVTTVRSSTLVGCKLVGTDFSGSTLRDVVFERCVFGQTNFRMAALERVRFAECTLDDVDFFETAFVDVDFDRSSLVDVNVDRVQATTADLRYASPLEIKGLGDMSGFLVTDAQVLELAHRLALATGLDIEQPG